MILNVTGIVYSNSIKVKMIIKNKVTLSIELS